MGEIKGMRFGCDLKSWGISLSVNLDSEWPNLVFVQFLCFSMEINRWQYWKSHER